MPVCIIKDLTSLSRSHWCRLPASQAGHTVGFVWHLWHLTFILYCSPAGSKHVQEQLRILLSEIKDNCHHRLWASLRENFRKGADDTESVWPRRSLWWQPPQCLLLNYSSILLIFPWHVRLSWLRRCKGTNIYLIPQGWSKSVEVLYVQSEVVPGNNFNWLSSRCSYSR